MKLWAVDSQFYHDEAGNLVLDDKHFYKYDAWNRVVEAYSNLDVNGDPIMTVVNDALQGSPGGLIGKYKYDAIGRRINKQVTNSDALNTTGDGDFFYYDGHRVIEHHKDGSSLHRQYVYGLNYIDEPVAYFDTDVAGAAPFYIFQDAGYNVVGVTDDLGNLQEQYSFEPYGERLAIEDGAGQPIAPENIRLSLGYKGLWEDPETETVHNRIRIYIPRFSRFGQRDPNESGLLLFATMLRNAQTPLAMLSIKVGTQYVDGMSLYQYLGSNPFVGADPSGLIVGSPRRMMTEMIGAATVSYAFGLDALIYAQLEEGAGSAGIDQALAAWPYLIPSALAGGLVSGVTGFSSTGNIIGGGIAGGITTAGMGVGFGQGFLTGILASTAIEGLFRGAQRLAGKYGGWLDSIVVGGGNSAGAFGSRWLRKIFGLRGLGRLFARGSGGQRLGAAGAAGTATRQQLQGLMEHQGQTITVYTRQTGVINPNRALSVAVGSPDLANAATNAGARTMSTARIPKALVDELEYIGLVRRSRTEMGGVIGEEIRFSSQAMEFVFEFFGRQ